MDGIYFGNINTNFLEQVEKKSAVLSLLARGNGAEIMNQEIKPDNLFTITPSDTEKTMEFFYILEGKVICKENEQVLGKGDYFYVQHLNQPVLFYTKTKTNILYFSTQPIFQFLSKKINDLHEIVQEVEEKDIYTHHHGKRVKEYSVKIAENLNISRDKIENLAFAALFHDIGKINVPDHILNKPASLTNEEYEIIKKHPVDGKEMVKGTLFQNLSKIIAQHHERLDGSGYPVGLTGKDILMEAQIIGVVDSYDAMTSDRPYRHGMPPVKAIQELRVLAGELYNKNVVTEFVKILKEEGSIEQENLPDL